MPLQFGINLWPHQWQDVSRIEELGYDSAWTSEHIFFYFPTFDALTSLAAMAARTSRIRLGTAVLLLPLRPAALAAKEIASVDNISGGRVILGAGVGGQYTREFGAVGVPVRERGARADEALRVLKLLYTQDNVQFEGLFTRLDGVTLAPKPVQPGGPPIWVAGRSEAAMRRAGRLGDGYLPYLFSPERFRDGLAKARGYAEKAGRDPSAITGAIYQFICLAGNYNEAKSLAAADLPAPLRPVLGVPPACQDSDLASRQDDGRLQVIVAGPDIFPAYGAALSSEPAHGRVLRALQIGLVSHASPLVV